jgi:hypothetical protein
MVYVTSVYAQEFPRQGKMSEMAEITGQYP